MTGISLPWVGPGRPSRRTMVVCVVALMAVLAGCGGAGTGGGGGDSGGAGTASTAQTSANGTGGAAGTERTTGGSMNNGTMNNGTMANGTTNGSMANASSGENASLRVAHMSPDAPAVDVAIDGRQVLTDVPFPEISTYLTVPAGRHQVRITAADNASNVLYEKAVTLEPKAYTLVASGETTRSTRTNTRFGATLLADRTAPSSGNASIRFVQTSPDAGTVDVTVNDTGEVLADNVTFANASQYTEVPAGNYTVSVRRATASNDGPVVNTFNANVTNGTAYTVFAAGYVTPGRAPVGVSFEPTTVTDGLDATIRFAHMSPDAPDVDVYVNGRLADQGLAYGGTTEYFEVPAGNRTVTITAANDTEPIFEGPVDLNASTNYTVVAAGEIGGDRPFKPIVLNDDLRTPNASDAAVRLVHTAPDAPPLDVETAGSGRVLFDDVAYGNATNYTTIPGGNYTFDSFVATPDNTGDDVASFQNEDVPGGSSYTLFLTGYVTPGDEPAAADVKLVVANDTEDYAGRETLD